MSGKYNEKYVEEYNAAIAAYNRGDYEKAAEFMPKAAKEGDEYAQMRQLEEATGVPIPENLSSLQGKPELHTGVIAKEAMLDYVLNL